MEASTRTWLMLLLGWLLIGCSRGPTYQPRRFPTAELAVAHWVSHEAEFREVAAKWGQAGGKEFYPYPEAWWWNGTRARKGWWGLGPWEVTRVAAPGVSVDNVRWSLEDAARVAGIPGSILTSLLGHAERLHLRSLEEVVTPQGLPCTRFDLDGGWMGRPNGFLHCPGTAEALRAEQVHGRWLCSAWVQEPVSEYQVIEKDWAYFGMSADIVE